VCAITVAREPARDEGRCAAGLTKRHSVKQRTRPTRTQLVFVYDMTACKEIDGVRERRNHITVNALLLNQLSGQPSAIRAMNIGWEGRQALSVITDERQTTNDQRETRRPRWFQWDLRGYNARFFFLRLVFCGIEVWLIIYATTIVY